MNICQRYFAQALDPIHVGTGGYRLGRVDLPIQREPGTNVPKVPGTALEGCARAFAALRHKRPHCAGQDANPSGDPEEEKKRKGHCGQCCVCWTFGFAKTKEAGGAFKGLAHFFDAQLLWMPVYSRVGPVWVTSPLLLEPVEPPPGNHPEGNWPREEALEGKLLVSPGLVTRGGKVRDLNLGWLKLPVQAELTEGQRAALAAAVRCAAEAALSAVLDRLVIVPDRLIAQIVNSNLEVRTSVSINPYTGAAEEGALFTYEALPRGSWLTFEVVYSDPELFWPATRPQENNGPNGKKWITREQAQGVVWGALEYFAYFGVGGLNTRGFGRLKVWQGEQNYGTF